MSSVRAALFTSFLTRYGTQTIYFISVMVLARLLTPEDIGIYTVGVAVIGLAHILRDFGVPNFVIQEKELTTDKLRTASGLAIIVGWSLALVIYSSSGWFSSIYDQPGIKDVLSVLVFNFLLIPFGVIAPALLKRDMNFKALFWIRISAAMINACTTIPLALYGYGYMSMAWGSLAGNITNVAISLYYLPEEYRLFPSLKEWRKIVRFSTYNTIILLMKALGKEGVNLVVGKLTSLELLGLYSRAYGYMDIFRRAGLDAIFPVLHSTLSRDNRAGAQMRASYLQVFKMILGIGLPSYFFLSAMSGPIILLLYGSQWTAAANVASILCVSGALTLITLVNSQTLLAIGDVKNLAIINVITQPIKLLIIILVAGHGLEAVAIGLLASELLHVIYSQYKITNILVLDIRKWWTALLHGVIIGGWSLVGPIVVRIYVPEEKYILSVMIAAITGALGWLVGLWVTRHPLRHEVIFMLSKLKTRFAN